MQLGKISLLLTDGASYAIKAGKVLSQTISGLKHVTCVFHGLHNLAETIREVNWRVDKLISFLKSSLVKNREKQNLFSNTTGICLPSWPVLTRWGTWMICAEWIFQNFIKIKNFVKILSEKYDTTANKSAWSNINHENLTDEINLVHSLKFIPDAILELESEKLSTEEQGNILKVVKEKLHPYPLYLERFIQILDRNPDIEFFLKFSLLKSNDEEKHYGFVPLTTVSVERSFSKYKDILTDKRKKLTIENLEKYLFIYFNKE